MCNEEDSCYLTLCVGRESGEGRAREAGRRVSSDQQRHQQHRQARRSTAGAHSQRAAGAGAALAHAPGPRRPRPRPAGHRTHRQRGQEGDQSNQFMLIFLNKYFKP